MVRSHQPVCPALFGGICSCIRSAYPREVVELPELGLGDDDNDEATEEDSTEDNLPLFQPGRTF